MDDIATVKDLIGYLEENFNQEDKLCFWHEGGAWIECEHLPKGDLGHWFLRKLSDEMAERWKDLNSRDNSYSKEDFDHDYRLIGNKDEYVLLY